MKKFLKLAIAGAMAAFGVANAATTTTIDLFSTPQLTLTDTGAVDGKARQSQVGSLADTSILGGYRELFTEVKNNNGVNSRKAEIGVDGGYLDFSTSTLTSGTGIVRWDGSSSGTDNAVISAIDPIGLREGGATGLNIGNVFSDSFALTTVFSDGGFTFVIEAYTDANNWSKVQLVSNAHPNPVTTYIPLLAFLDCGFNAGGIIVTCANGTDAVDFSNLGALQVILDPQGTFTSLDLTLDSIVTSVPEPGSVALVGLALLAAGGSARRMSRRS